MTGRGTRPQEAQPSYPGIRFPPRHPRAAAVTPSRARPSGSLLLALAGQERFLHSVNGDVQGGASSPHTEQAFPLHSLVQLLQESWTRLHAHQCSLSPSLTLFFFLNHKKVFSNPFLGSLKLSGDRVLLRKGVCMTASCKEVMYFCL